MKVIDLNDVILSGRAVECPNGGFMSYRYAVESDGMGFSLHKTMIPRGEEQHWHYKNHLEACFCVSGKGILTNLSENVVYYINPDTCYLLDRHDDHLFQAITDTVLISVLNPPVKGREVHREDGSYE